MGRQQCGLELAGHCSGLQENYSGKLFFLLKEEGRPTCSETCAALTGCIKGWVLQLLIQYLSGDQILHFLVF